MGLGRYKRRPGFAIFWGGQLMEIWKDEKMIINGDCLEELEKIEKNSIDSIITDPPYELNFMGKGWDNAGVSFRPDTWQKCYEVLKPGGYLLAFGGSRTFHRIACAIEDAGFEIRDTIMWLYGSGFPKSMNIGLAIDKKNGIEVKSSYVANEKNNVYGNKMGGGKTDKSLKAQNEWQGWGTALKPSFEPIIVARKPFKGSLVDNVIEYGVGGINIDECRVEYEKTTNPATNPLYRQQNADKYKQVQGGELSNGAVSWTSGKNGVSEMGRFPANTILTYDETDFDEVCGGFPQSKGGSGKGFKKDDYVFGETATSFGRGDFKPYNDSGSASRYFYCAKASKKDRDEGLDDFEESTSMCDRNPELESANMPQNRSGNLRKNTHPTVKPTSLMQYLVRLVSPKGSTILDPFMGSGSTGKAVEYENKERNANYRFIGIEKDAEYCKIAEARIKAAKKYNERIKNEQNSKKIK